MCNAVTKCTYWVDRNNSWHVTNVDTAKSLIDFLLLPDTIHTTLLHENLRLYDLQFLFNQHQ